MPAAVWPVANGVPLPTRVVREASEYHFKLVPDAVRSAILLLQHSVSTAEGADGTAVTIISLSALPMHPFKSVYVYVIVCVPAPATDALKFVPLTPVPL